MGSSQGPTKATKSTAADTRRPELEDSRALAAATPPAREVVGPGERATEATVTATATQPPMGAEQAGPPVDEADGVALEPLDLGVEAAETSAKATGFTRRAHSWMVHRILKVDDTPHRIALGVFLGTFIAFLPLIGLQMVLLIPLAALLGANKASGIPSIWITNPVTAMPIYYACWWVGRVLVSGETKGSDAIAAALRRVFELEADQGMFERLFSRDFWTAAFQILSEFGLELWVGCTVLGLVFGAVAYWLTYRAVVAYRAHRTAVSRARPRRRHVAGPRESGQPTDGIEG